MNVKESIDKHYINSINAKLSILNKVIYEWPSQQLYISIVYGIGYTFGSPVENATEIYLYLGIL
jgi:DNA-binding winged helix-turn-helix (wHTH) protein